MPRRSVKDARILVTGASSGIGREFARAAARRGARMVLVARRAELLDELCGECEQLGGEATRVAGDVVDEEVQHAAVQAACQTLGGLDVLVNNAGVSAHGRFEESEPTTLQRIMDVNFFAAVELTRKALPLIRDRAERLANAPAAVVNIGSILGHRGAPYNNEYCASKFALRGWSESLRAEVANDGVVVTLVSPGTTDTKFFEHLVAKTGALPWGAVKGVSPEIVARQTLHSIEHGKREVFPNWRGRLLVAANRLLPSVVDWRMRRLGSRES